MREGIETFFATLPAGVAGVAEIPLLYETGRQADFDLVVVTACQRTTQLTRLVSRDGLSPAAAADRLAAQWPVEDKVRLADAVILTDGAKADTERQVDRLSAWLSTR